MTNEHYLRVFYFIAAGCGSALAAITALVLRKSLRRAAGAGKVGTLLRRAFPTWLILAVVLGFASVSYFDCGHQDYASVVATRPYLVAKTHEQASQMLYYLAAALLAYAMVLAVVLGILRGRSGKTQQPADRQ